MCYIKYSTGTKGDFFMFNFSTLITLFFTVIGIYFPTYFIFKKEINDLRLNENEENRQKIIIREKSVKTLNKTVIALILIIMILFSLPYIISLFTTNSSEILGKNIRSEERRVGKECRL